MSASDQVDAVARAGARYASELTSWRESRRFSKRALAERMVYDRTYIVHIEAGRQAPTAAFTRRAEEVLQTDGALWAAWEAYLETKAHPQRSGRMRVDRELGVAGFIGWVTERSSLSFEDAYLAVLDRVQALEAVPMSARAGRVHARSGITRAQLAELLHGYYDTGHRAGAFYRARVDGSQLALSILRPNGDSLDQAVPVDTDAERITYIAPAPARDPEPLNDLGLDAAVRRLAEIEVTGTVVVDHPLYRLLDVELSGGVLEATLTLSDFLTYALTADLLETELLTDLGASTAGGGSLPLRDLYLPTVASAWDFPGRRCIGGVEGLLAIARQDVGDYLILVQVRSGRVLNLTGRLATIPKAFHQPVIEPALEAGLGRTLERELEEELFGREDLDFLVHDRRVDPLHPARRSEPLRWLIDRPGTYQVDCTGFGINAMTGNYEFPCLIVVDDPAWWDRFGDQVEANWETTGLQRYSSLDTSGLAALACDPQWSNEGLFALLQGLRHLGTVGNPDRMALPTIELET